MEKIRIGKDFTIEWAILTNGDPIPLHGRDLLLEMHTPSRKSISIPFTTSGIDINVRISPDWQTSLGKYSFTLWENYGKDGQTMVDSCDAFQLVDNTCKEGQSGCGCTTNIQSHHVNLTMSNMTFSPIVIDGGGCDIKVDSSLSETSENPVQNKVVTSAIYEVSRTASNASDAAKQASEDVETLNKTVEGISVGGFVWQNVK